MTLSRRKALLAPVLVVTTLIASIVSSLGAPLIPSISEKMNIPLSTAQWALTAALLAGAVSAPIMGRLGDGPRRRGTLLVGLSAVTIGGIVSAVAPGIGVLLVGRFLQGIGLGLAPLAMAVARDELPEERVAPTIGLLSVSASAGVGAGYPISGLLAEHLGLSAAFWFGAAFGAVVLLCVAVVVPPNSVDSRPKLDIGGAMLLTVGMVTLLIALAQGSSWGWSSPAIVVSLAAAGVSLGGWVVHQLHVRSPLVELRLLRHPAVLAGNTCALVLGAATYTNMSAVTEFLQVPSTSGFGFAASVSVAGLCLVPYSVAGFAITRALPSLSRMLGAGRVLALGSLVVAAAGAFFVFLHSSLWQAFFATGLLGIGLGLTFAAIPGLLVVAIPHHETGSALGFYNVIRFVGFSMGSASAASILAGSVQVAGGRATEAGYVHVMWLSSACGGLAALIAACVDSAPSISDSATGARDDQVRL